MWSDPFYTFKQPYWKFQDSYADYTGDQYNVKKPEYRSREQRYYEQKENYPGSTRQNVRANPFSGTSPELAQKLLTRIALRNRRKRKLHSASLNSSIWYVNKKAMPMKSYWVVRNKKRRNKSFYN